MVGFYWKWVPKGLGFRGSYAVNFWVFYGSLIMDSDIRV